MLAAMAEFFRLYSSLMAYRQIQHFNIKWTGAELIFKLHSNYGHRCGYGFDQILTHKGLISVQVQSKVGFV